MRIIRFSDGRTKYGVLRGDAVYELKTNPFTEERKSFQLGDTTCNLGDVKLLAPCTPSKLVCLGLNYRSHAQEFNLSIPEVPLIFLKPSTSVIGPDEEIVLPPSSKRVDYEGELAVVIGKRAKDVPEDRARDYVLGYTCFNDVTERHNQKADGQWTRGKGYDTFAPLGPWIETEISPGDLKLETYVNGEVRQWVRTSDLIFGVSRLVSFISEVMTLLPGDVIATGTPSGIGRLNPGDTVSVTIEGIGSLTNSVVRWG
ncbi:MAG: fumarylacetoacetate hydrolase family protein [Chloroflexota bacterium]